MASNYIQPGEAINFVAPSGGVTGGVGVLLGDHLFLVANMAAAEGERATGGCEGVWRLAKTEALAISVGDLVYWDNTNKVVNKTATAQKLVGIAVAAAANPSTSVLVKLIPNGVLVTGGG